ncbi:MAG: hypothetical protein LW706_04300 [Chitinophagaceae bacterium]|nr:hypothetical protein [Chitinophagaceae bacterium]
MKNVRRNSATLFSVLLLFGFTVSSCSNAQSDPQLQTAIAKSKVEKLVDKTVVPTLDTSAYRKKFNAMLNGDSSEKWKFKGDFPLAGAWLPQHRVIAYYGNLYSTRMGILGELPKPQMFAKLKGELENWRKKYRLRMPNKEIDKVMSMAAEIDALVFLDIQVGLSNLREEIPVIEKYLQLPNVHLGIDPEFSMKGGQRPGTVIGTFDAGDINYATQYLKELVQKNNLPPKMLVIHRFTQNMVREYKSIKKHPEVQIIVDMDGWGAPARKINTYKQFVYGEPIQFTGFKLFYKNDLKEPPHRMLTPAELLKLKPVPMYIQYQ